MQPDKQIQIVFFADTHLGFDYPIRPKVERRRRGQDFFDNYQRVLSYALESKADLLVHGGDLFFRSRLPKKIIDLAYGPLIQFADNNIPVFLVPGNHERSNLPTSLFLNHPYIHVFDRAQTIAINVKGAEIAISGFPFERDDIRNRFQNMLEATEWKKAAADIKLLCMHQIVEGAQVGSSNYTFRHGKDVIRLSHLPQDFYAVLAGHIHRQQILSRSTEDNAVRMPIIYPGSTERTSFAEKGEKKGFFEIVFCSCNDGGWHIEDMRFIELPTRPMEDIYLTSELRVRDVRSFLQSKISCFDLDSIVRIQCDRHTDDGVRKMLTGSFLRDVFPRTMNVQFSSYWSRPTGENR